MNTKRKHKETKVGMPDLAKLPGDIKPSLHEQFGSAVTQMEAVERKNMLAILKICELIVSGRIPQRAGEDYFVTTCRLIVHGLSGVQTTAATRRALNKALAEIKWGAAGAARLADLEKMRGWRGNDAVTRTVLLLTMLEKSIGRGALTGWLRRPNSNLGGRVPVDLMRAGRWVVLADFVDDMLTGSTT